MRYFILALIYLLISCNSSTKPEITYNLMEDGKITIGIYSDQGAHPSCRVAAEEMFKWMGYQIRSIYREDVNGEDLLDCDLIYFPGGDTQPYRDMISETGRNYLKRLIGEGRGFIGTCAGALYAGEVMTWNNGSVSKDQLGIFPGKVIGPIPDIHQNPSYGMCRINLTDHPINIGEPNSHSIMYYNGPYFEINPGVDIVATYDEVNVPAMVTTTYGKGRVLLTGPHPEWEEDSSRDKVSYFDHFDDEGSEWNLMKKGVEWCLRLE
jgi:glutamine amidotransferase-like uncharacterized protein